MKSPDRPQPYPHPARLILILSLAPTVGLGIGRFAYALVLPDMRDSLVWSYSAAGFMNTINAAGYLVGALFASQLIRRFGLAAAARWGTLGCVLSLALCALSGNFFVLSFARLLAGFAAAACFVGGGALAATIAQSRPERANFLLSLFYAGPGIGIVASGLIAPYVLQAFGPGSWWIVWWALTALAVVMTVPLLLAPLGDGAGTTDTKAAKFAIGRSLFYLAGLFSVRRGLHRLHDLHDRLCPRLRRRSRGAERVLVPDRPLRFRDALGVAPRARARPRRACHHHHPRHQRDRRGAADLRPFAAAARRYRRWCSAWRSSAVVGSTTAFVRFNYPPAAWPTAIAAMTIAFGIGQTLGPIAVGAITDAMGSLSYALNVSAAMLALGAVLSAFQRKLVKTS